MLTRRRAAVALAAVVMVAAGCSTSQTTTGAGSADPVTPADPAESAPTTRPRIAHGVIEQVSCDDDASCAEEFRLNGRVYAGSCGLVDPTQVDLDDELGQGWFTGREVQAHALRLDPSYGVITISAPPGTTGCVEEPDPDAPTSPWQFAFAYAASTDSSIICSAGLFTPAEATANGCDE